MLNNSVIQMQNLVALTEREHDERERRATLSQMNLKT